MARQPKLGRDLYPGSDAKIMTPVARTFAVGYAAFTDGGSTVGTFVLVDADGDAVVIPKGAYYIGTIVKVPDGFTGDTSAALTVGDGTDVDRYNTSTVNVFADAPNGVAAGIPSGAQHHTAAVSTVTLTVTTAADWGDVDGGQVAVTLMYWI